MTAMLTGRNAIITGASQGLGRAIAEAYVAAGASVCVCARDGHLIDEVRDALRARAVPGQKVVSVQADVSQASDVQRVIDTALQEFAQIHVLVNNAGVYGPMGPIETIDWVEWVRAIEINLLGSVLCCRAIVPHFKANGGGKIVQLSGGGATQPLPNISAYAASKAAIVRFAETLAQETKAFGIDVNSIAPGALKTRLLDQLLATNPTEIGQAFYDRMAKLKNEGSTPLEVGASLAVFLGSTASNGITGKLLSAQWDPWQTLPSHADELRDSDIYTLRRIVPKDRGFTWGD